MKIIQILIVIGFVIYIVFSSINMMEQYSEEAKKKFRSERNWKICISIIIWHVAFFGNGLYTLLPAVRIN